MLRSFHEPHYGEHCNYEMTVLVRDEPAKLYDASVIQPTEGRLSVPRFVDAEARKAEILDAVIGALGDGGFTTFSLRSIAKRIGGSSTLITHYFPTREALIEALLVKVLNDADEAREELLQITERGERLYAVLDYFLPSDPESLELERVRIALLAHRDAEIGIRTFFDRLEPGMRGLMRAALDEFIEPDELEQMVDVLRIWVSGMALSAVEHPEIWTPERQRRALAQFLQSTDLPLTRLSPAPATPVD